MHLVPGKYEEIHQRVEDKKLVLGVQFQILKDSSPATIQCSALFKKYMHNKVF